MTSIINGRVFKGVFVLWLIVEIYFMAIYEENSIYQLHLTSSKILILAEVSAYLIGAGVMP